MSIRNLPARYPELGRIRFGDKGPKGEPRKGKTLRFSSNDDVTLKALASQHGGDVIPWENGEQAWHLVTETVSIPVFLPADPIDTWYEKWGKGGIHRRCDGERCTRPVINEDGGFMEEVDCLCLSEGMTPGDREDVKQGACQVTVRLRVVIPDVPGIGIWMATSHSIYAALELPGQVALLDAMRDRGQLVPAELAIDARTEKKPWEKFKREYIVPVIRVRSSLRQLQSGEHSMSPALPSGTGGDGVSTVETTARAAIGNGDAEATAGGRTEPPAISQRSGAEKAAGTGTIPAAALRSIRSQGDKKGLRDPELKAMADGKPLESLTIDEGNAVLAKVSAYVKPEDDEGRPFE